MKRTFGILLGLLFLFQTNAFATMISDDSNGYPVASHSTATWQRLGESEYANDGVFWSVDGGAYGNEDVSVGDLVTFKFDFWHQGWGIHDYDQLKVWYDTDSTDDFTGSTVLLSEKHVKIANTVWTYNPENVEKENAEKNAYYSLTEEVLLITSDMVGLLFLRARVHCNHTPWDNMVPAGLLWQGEVEDYFITVNTVPEPTTILLSGLGLLGMGAYIRRRKKK